MGYVFDALRRIKDQSASTSDGQAMVGDSTTSDVMLPEDSAGITPDALHQHDESALSSALSHDQDAELAESACSPDLNPSMETSPTREQPAQSDLVTTETTLDIPTHVIPLTPRQMRQLDDRLVMLINPSANMAEEYRAIRTSLLARWQQQRHKICTITSATPQEGKTITSLNLGLAFAELRNRRTVVVEADLRLPTFDKLLGIRSDTGLLPYLRGEAELGQITQELGESGLAVISAGGRSTSDTVQLLSSERMAQLMQWLGERFDHVIIDTPPVIELADAGIVGARSDDVMLIVRMLRTPQPLVEQAVRILTSYNASVAGIIATDHKQSHRRYYAYRYGYRYRYQYSDQRAA